MDTSSNNLRDQLEWLNRCRGLARHWKAGEISFPEFAYNITLALVCLTEDCIKVGVDYIPDTVLPDYWNYLQEYLEPVDFMPCPLPFLVGRSSEAETRKKLELRPRYLQLYNFVKNRISSQKPELNEGHRS